MNKNKTSFVGKMIKGSFVYEEETKYKASYGREIKYLIVLCKCGKKFEISENAFSWGTTICKICRDNKKPLKKAKKVKSQKKKKIKFRKNEIIYFQGNKTTISDMCKQYELNYQTIAARRKRGKVNDELFIGLTCVLRKSFYTEYNHLKMLEME